MAMLAKTSATATHMCCDCRFEALGVVRFAGNCAIALADVYSTCPGWAGLKTEEVMECLRLTVGGHIKVKR